MLRESVELSLNLIDVADSSGPFDYEELIAQALNPYSENLRECQRTRSRRGRSTSAPKLRAG
ncbi:MAG TPA: hypothetical protein VG674_10685 [Amycolatopsis sp.]|nr:hypothetical protein [Amycolatopsis sp.]